MKYSILGFQQEKMLEHNLIAEDAIILRTIKDMIASSRMQKYGDFSWIKLDYFCDQIPLVGKKRFIQKRLSCYMEIGLIDKMVIYEYRGQKGTFHFIKLLPKLDDFEDYDLMHDMHEGGCTPCMGGVHDMHTKDSSLKDSSLKDINNNNMSFQDEIFKYWCEKAEDENALIKHKSKSKAIENTLLAINKLYSIEKAKELIDRFCIVYNNPSSEEFRIRKRSLTEFFGQKAYQKKWLICEEYDDEGCKWLTYNEAIKKVGDTNDKNRGTNGERKGAAKSESREGKTNSQRAEEIMRSAGGPIEDIKCDF